MDGLLEKLISMNIGATIGYVNTSTVAYCDDVVVLSPLEHHMQMLLDGCSEYAVDWKLSFNPDKSDSYSLKGSDRTFVLGGKPIPSSSGFIYLGLPVGNVKFVEKFYSERMSKAERAMYSLKPLGCSPNKLHPYAIGFIFKQFCQSILKFGFEFVHLRKSFLDGLNIRQNLLLKNILGIRHRARFKPLLNELKVEQVNLAYVKHKVFGWKQCVNNQLTLNIFNYLSSLMPNLSNNNFSFIKQLSEVVGSKKLTVRNVDPILKELDGNYECNDMSVRELVSSALKNYHRNEPYFCIQNLNNILKIIF